VVPPKLTACAIHFAPTDIGLPHNAGIAVQTTRFHSLARLKRELQLGSDECNFQRNRCTSLAASASLLSSVIAFICSRNYLRKRMDVKAG
jgi:hypothetical protein